MNDWARLLNLDVGKLRSSVSKRGIWICVCVVVLFGIDANLALAQTAAQKQVLKTCVALVLPSWLQQPSVCGRLESTVF